MIIEPEEDSLPADLNKALQDAWSAIRRHHRQLPAARVIAGPKDSACASIDWGSSPVTIQVDPRFKGSAEKMANGVLTYLLHQAAHGLALESGLNRSSEGRYHPDGYAHVAEMLGLDVNTKIGTGWSLTTLQPGTTEVYATTLARLRAGLEDWDPPEIRAGRNGVVALCSCGPPRRIRVSNREWSRGEITCGTCGQEFQPVG